MNSRALLNYIAKYIELSEEEEIMLLSKTTYRKYLKNQYLVQQGDVCKSLSFVINGCTKTFHVDHGGHEHIIRFALENWWSADLASFMKQQVADCNVQCLEPTEVYQISKENLSLLLVEVPKMERLFRIIFQNAFTSAEKRLLNNFSHSAKERYLLFQKQYPQIEQRVPQYMIASYLGITKQFLSKIRNELLFKK